MLDFPAAHSMDTNWFAIDAEENVAVFETWESGALPYSVLELSQTKRQKGIYSVYDLIRYLPKDDRGIAHLKTDGAIAAKGVILKTLRNDISRSFDSFLYRILLVLASEEVLFRLLGSKGSMIARFAGEPIVIYMDRY